MQIIVFKNKTKDSYYALNEEHKFITVYINKDVDVTFKQAKNGSLYFKAEAEAKTSKKTGKVYYVVTKVI